MISIFKKLISLRYIGRFRKIDIILLFDNLTDSFSNVLKF